MGDFLDFFRKLPATNDWPALWQSGHWTSFEGWMYVIGDSVLWMSFLVIAIIATRFAGKTGKGIMGRFSPVIIWLAFITSAVLFMDVFMFWIPAYRLNALMRACAAIVSIVAIYKLTKYIPDLLALRPAEENQQPASTIMADRVRVLEDEIRRVKDEKETKAALNLQADELIDELQARLKEVSNERSNEIAELSVANEELKLQNRLMERKFADCTMQLEAANRELDAFSYAVSHDMRAPVRIINGYTEMLRSDYGKTLDAEANRLLDVISANTTQMSGMIDAVLSLARTGRKDLMILPADMTSIIKSTITEQVNSTGSKAVFSLGDIHAVSCDSVLIRSVWSNLISNALKYTAHLEQPQIQIGSERKDGKVMYFIKDNGIGFDMQYVHRLFGIFQKLHKNTTPNSLGTGLALVQRVVLKHGGYAWAEGIENRGATFYFTLPENRN